MSPLNNLISSFRLVYASWSAWLITCLVAGLFGVMSIWLLSLGFLRYVFTVGLYTWPEKVRVLLDFPALAAIRFTPETVVIVLVMAILTGVNMALLTHYLRTRITADRQLGIGLLGVVVGLLGLGCLSCGSIIIASLIGVAASTAFLGVLPLHGLEFGLSGIGLIVLSIYLLAQKIPNPLVCRR